VRTLLVISLSFVLTGCGRNSGTNGLTSRPTLDQDISTANVSASQTAANQPKSDVDFLISDLETGDKHRRQKSLAVLAKMGPPAKQAVSAILKCLKDPDPILRGWAMNALAAIESDTEEVILAAGSAIRHEHPWVQSSAERILRRAGPRARVATPLLLAAIKDKSNNNRASAAGILWLVDRQSEVISPWWKHLPTQILGPEMPRLSIWLGLDRMLRRPCRS